LWGACSSVLRASTRRWWRRALQSLGARGRGECRDVARMAIICASTTLTIELFVRFEEQLILSIDWFEMKSQLETTTAQDLLEDRKARLPPSRLDVVDDGTRYPRRHGELRNTEVGSDAGAADECRSKLA
jgi:hypothetical protein